jgi:acetolactate synthase small subunit
VFENSLEAIEGAVIDLSERAYHLERYGTPEEKDKFIEYVAMFEGIKDLEEKKW